MNEQQLNERFRDAVAGEPPLGFDPDDTVSRAVQRSHRRRAVAGASVATAVLAVAVVGVTARTANRPGQAGTPTTGTSATVEVTPRGTVPPEKSIEVTPTKPIPATPSDPGAEFPGSRAVVAHLRTVVPQVLRDHVHTATFTEPDSFGVVSDSREVGGPYRATGTKHRYVSVWVLHERDQLDLSNDPVAPWTKDGSTVLVSDTAQQDGSHLRVYRSVDTSSGGLQVVHLRTDGVIVQAGTDSKPETGQSGFIVDTTTLTSIATDPRLTF